MAIVYRQPVTYEQQKDIIQSQETQTALDAIKKSISDETLTRQNDDVNLNLRVDSVVENLASETAIRTAAENQIKADLITETNQRTAADFNLETLITNEVAARVAAESSLRDDFNNGLDAEKVARAQAIQDMRAAILVSMGDDKAAEAIENEKLREQIEEAAASQSANLTALTARVNTEEQTRAAEITALQAAMAEEETARKNADTEISGNLTTAINKEIADRENEISRLDTKINNAKSTLKASINTEIADRQNAISAVQTSISNSINTEIQNRNSAIETATNSTKNYIDQQISSVEGNLNDFTAPTATENGNRGLVPAPAAGVELKLLTNFGWRSAGDTTLTISEVPAQVGTLNFSGNVQEPTWLNFDNKKLKIEGETSGTAAKVYTVTFTPIDIYLWADTLDQTPKTQTWEIQNATLAKPTAAVTEFTFNNAAQGLTVVNFNSEYINQTGTISETNAGSYNAVFTLKNKTNTKWADNSTDDVNISWKINPLKLEKPTAAVTEFTYDSTTKTLDVENYNSTYESQTGTTSAVNANSYSVIYKLRNTTNTRWSDNSTGNVTITWKIAPLLLAKPTASITSFNYDSTAKTLSVANFNSTYENQTGVISATAVGEYSAVYQLKNTTNTKWTDETVADVTINWQIVQLALTSAQSTGFAQVGDLEYNGQEQTPVIKNYDPAYHVLGSDTSKTDAGTYYVTVSPKDNYTWKNGTTTAKKVKWTIDRILLPIPTISTTEFQYDGTEKTVEVKNFNADLETQTGVISDTNCGTKKVTFALKDTTNYRWEGGSKNSIIIWWYIRPIAVPDVTCSTTSFTYSGEPKTVVLENFDETLMIAYDTTETDAGNYTAQIELKDTLNYNWESTESSAPIFFDWVILPKKLSAAQGTFSQATALTYNATEQTVTIKNYNPEYHILYGAESATFAGTYIAEIEPQPNYTWSDGTVTKKQVEWTIDVLKIYTPYKTPIWQFVYTGNLQTPKFTSDDSAHKFEIYSTKSGDLSATDTGTYYTTFKLRAIDRGSVIWDSLYSTDDYVVRWIIHEESIDKKQSSGFAQDGTLTYTGSSQTVSIKNYDPTYHVLSGTTQATNAGFYEAQIAPQKNYQWYNQGGTDPQTVTWEIKPVTLAIPTAAETYFNYDNTTKTLNVEGYDSTKMTRSGTYSAKAAGSYTVKYTLKDTVNNAWQNGSTEPVTIEWTIGLTKVSAPVMTASSFVYDGNAKTPTFEGVDTSVMTQGGDTSEVNAGSYTVTFALTNPALYMWDDSTTENKTYNWQITRKPLTSTQSTFSQSGTLNYNANTQTVTISNYNTNYHSLGGVYSAVNANTYTAKISPLPNYCFSDGTTSAKSVQWTISPLKLVKPSAATTNFTYDKNSHALNISNFNSTYENQSGTASATNAGAYSVKFSLKSKTNTTWADETVGDVTIPWSITKLTFAKPTASTTTFTYYTGKTQNLTVTGYNSTYMTQNGTTSEKNAGSYSVTYSLADKTLYTWEDSTTTDVVINWTVERYRLPSTSSNPYQKTAITYDGSKKYLLTTTNLSGYVNTQVWSGETTATDAGKYTAYVEPAENYCWNDSTTTKKAVEWEISPAQISAPAVDTSTTLTYNEAAQSPTLTGFDANKMTLGGDTSATAAGDYVLTVTPTSNYCWEDSTQDAINLEWKINWLVIARPSWKTITSNSFNGTLQVAAPITYWVAYDSATDSVDWSKCVKNFDTDLMTVSGVFKALEANRYYITFTLKNSNHSFVSSKSVATSQVNWVLAMTSYEILLTNNGIISYDGAEHAAPFSKTINENAITITGTKTATAVGNYQTTLTLKYPLSSSFRIAKTDGSSGYTYSKDAQTFNWSIGMSQITAPTFGTDYFDYNGTRRTLTISGFDSATMTKTGTESASAKGIYTVTISLKDKTNNCWSTGGGADIVKEWAIGKKRVAKPVLADDAETEFTYSGSAKTLNVTGYDSNSMTMTGYLSATDAGDYTVKFVPRSTTACTYVWQDGSSEEVTFTWKINRAALPEVTFKGNFVAYDGTLKTATITNFDASIHEITGGNVTGTAAGTYTVRISPKSNYTWADGSTGSKIVFWYIYKKFFNKVTAARTVFEYTGSNQTLTLNNFNSDWMTVTGNSATAAGSYTATISLKDTLNTYWPGGTTPVTINWSIGALYVEVPTISPVTQVSQGLNATHSVTVSGFDSNTMTQSGTVLTGTGAAATYDVVFSLKNDSLKWADGSVEDKTVSWTVTKKILTAAESTFVQDTAITHQGRTATDVIYRATDACSAIKADYLNQYYTLSGYTFHDYSVPPGTHTAVITPTEAACWADQTSTAKNLVWTVDKLPWKPNFSPNKYTTAKGNFNGGSWSGNELITWAATSSNVNVATINNDEHYDNYIMLKVIGNGSTTITVTFSSEWYVVPEPYSYTLDVRIPLNDLDWRQLKTYLSDGTFGEYFSVGDSKQVALSGTVGTLELSDTYRAVLIGIDHNAGIEGKPRAHFAIMQNSAGNRKIAFVDQFYNSPTDNNQAFTIWTEQGDEGSIRTYYQYILRTRCSEFLNALPADLRAVVASKRKPYLTATGSISYVYDKIWILSPFEVFGKTQNSGMCSYYQVYDYFANGNSKICCRHDNNGTAVNYYLRDGDFYDGGNNKYLTGAHSFVSTSGTYSQASLSDDISRGIVPCFTI